ncbi:membrane protein insertase YidC [Candidatus Berkelbacteria bacterium]|nr:membrane protein insertase YidC [Candidatus Berkelbacteria bacterium]
MKELIKTILYKPLFNLLVFLAWLVPGHSIGWAIIGITIIVKGLLWKLSLKTLKVPLEMNLHRDELKQLQERHKDNRNALAQAQMAFYKEKGINPLAGCLPLLIQLPILLILYRVFIVGLNDLRPDLIYSFTPHLDTLNTMFFGIDLSKPDPYFIIPALAALLQFLQTRHMQQLNPPIGDPKKDPAVMMNKQMMYLFPAMTFFISFKFPAGLPLYWAASTALTWVQQIYVQKTFKPEAKAKVVVRSKKK